MIRSPIVTRKGREYMRRVCGTKVARFTLGDLSTCHGLPAPQDAAMRRQKSAEGIVAAAHGGEDPNMEDRKGAYYLVGRGRRKQDG